MGVPESQIATVVDIARHIREEAGALLDSKFSRKIMETAEKPAPSISDFAIEVETDDSCGCSTTKSGQSCC